MRFAAEQLKGLYEGKGKMRLKLFISVKGVRLYEPATMVSSVDTHTQTRIHTHTHTHTQTRDVRYY